MKAALHHVRRSCDLSSRTSSAAHSRASGIFPASLKARAFAKAWLSADRSAADSFPDRALRALRAAADMLRIATGPTRFRPATYLDRQRFDRNVYSCRASSRWSLPRMLPQIGADVTTGTGRGAVPPPACGTGARGLHIARSIDPARDPSRVLSRIGSLGPPLRRPLRAASAHFGRDAGPTSTRLRQPAPPRARGAIPPGGRGWSGNRQRPAVGSRRFLPILIIDRIGVADIGIVPAEACRGP